MLTQRSTACAKAETAPGAYAFLSPPLDRIRFPAAVCLLAALVLSCAAAACSTNGDPVVERSSAVGVSYCCGSEAFTLLIDAEHHNVDSEADPPRGILFDSNRDGTVELYEIRADGTERRLTRSREGEFSRTPAWSPDGSRIVFQSGTRRTGPLALFVIDADGTGRRLLVGGEENFFSPDWSPTGDLIAFRVDRGDSTVRVDAVAPDGSGRRELIAEPAWSPAWSPDGEELAYVASGDGTWNLFLIARDGSRRRQLTHFVGEAGAGGPAWSPDGLRIAFNSDEDGNSNIYVIDADGTDLHRLTSSPAMEAGPSWSCDGQWIAFHSDRDSSFEGEEMSRGFEIYLMRPDGSDVRRLTNNTATDAHPDAC